MRKFLLLLLLPLAVSCVKTGLDDSMNSVLENIENELGYVNTISNEDMSKIADWFDRHGNDKQKAKALYCLGRQKFNSKEYSSAIVAYTRALELAQQSSDTLSVAKICFDMGHVYGTSGNSTDEIKYLARSSVAFKEYGMVNESLLALNEIGDAQAAVGKYDTAEELFRSVLADAHELKDTLLEARCLESFAALSVSRDSADASLAIELLSRAANELNYPLSCKSKGILAYSYSLAGHQKEAETWLAAGFASAETQVQRMDLRFREYQIATRKGDSKRALEALEEVLEYGNMTNSMELEEAVGTSQREYVEEQAAMQAEKLRSARLKLMVTILGAIIVLIASFYIVSLHIRKEKEEIEKERAETEKFMSLAEDLQTKLSEADRVIPNERRLVAGKYDALERLCEQYYVYEGTENLQPKILKEVKSIVEGFRSDKLAQQSLWDMLDKNLDGVMTKIRAEYPSWKEEDFLLFGFAVAGFSNTTISTLLGKDKSVIYNRVWRLKGRISSSDSKDKDFFLKCLTS